MKEQASVNAQQQEKEKNIWVERQIGGGLLFTAPVVFSADSKFVVVFLLLDVYW